MTHINQCNTVFVVCINVITVIIVNIYNQYNRYSVCRLPSGCIVAVNILPELCSRTRANGLGGSSGVASFDVYNATRQNMSNILLFFGCLVWTSCCIASASRYQGISESRSVTSSRIGTSLYGGSESRICKYCHYCKSSKCPLSSIARHK
ncbi:hypothetical protein QVD99_000005 [Batrachochytrium dendrobatidis]|nr:hypothetical protein QVD99_000005 [Batrachochytrium dendrobatidis]